MHTAFSKLGATATDTKEELQATTGIEVTHADICLLFSRKSGQAFYQPHQR